jgi:beta-galactosidase
MILQKLLFSLIMLLTFTSVNCQQLYVGTNYHPHDLSPQQYIRDIKLMKEAGFTVVRMGHLAWDSYEPEEGEFKFEWFDKVMDQMADAGIKVILDIAVRPAPLWLHKKYPSINIVDTEGNIQYPNTRYMEDVGNPIFQSYALRFTDEMTKHYGNHPALLAFGIDNEPSGGKVSYSEEVKNRFIFWLKQKYKTTDALNKAWAGQRWSRKISQFDEIGLPILNDAIRGGAPERKLDFQQFLSDEINNFYFKMIDIVNQNAPDALTNTNAWYYCESDKYYDYAPMAYSGKMTREGNGFYPGMSLLSDNGIKDALFGITRIQYESKTPFWCNEFTSMTAVPGAIRKQAYLTLMYGNQMICGWTWQTMNGGEEQYLQGMMDWDGKTNSKYEEYKQIAQEFKKIAPWFPYQLKAEVALAYTFPSQVASKARLYPADVHEKQVRQCFDLFYDRNMDVCMIDPERSFLNYKLLIIPGMSIINETTALKIRKFIKEGGTVVMTSRSGMVDENGKVITTTQPAYLNDVFGIRIGGYNETKIINEISKLSYKDKSLKITYRNNDIEVESSKYDLIEPQGATVLGNISSLDKDYPIVTSNIYGKGRAIYIGLSANSNLLSPIIDSLIAELNLRKGPEMPVGIKARQVDDKHILLFNMTNEPKEIKLNSKAKSILLEKKYENSFIIKPHEPDFIEVEK